MIRPGHEGAWQQWRAALAGPRMHHGWILAGKRGLGKTRFALEAARELVAEDGVAQPTSDHPDILHLTHPPKNDAEMRKRDDGKPFETARNIKVDQIRAMQRRLNTRPTLGSRRAIVIDPADDLEKGASNALLKSLEEPPVGSFFLLVTHRPGRLLPTIRSRCRMLNFLPLSDDAIDAYLREHAPQADGDARAAAIASAGGSPGAALEFIQMDLAKMHALMREITVSGDIDFIRRGALARAMGARPDRQRQLAALEVARAVLADRMADTPRAAIPALADTHADLARLTSQVPTYNFDPGLLVMEIGTLLANVAASRNAADG